MSIGAGFSSKTAFRHEATQSSYGTPIACGAGDQVPLVTESLSKAIEKEPDTIIRNQAGYGPADVTGVAVAGPVQMELCYRGLEALLCAAMGFQRIDDPATVAAGVYKHTIELSENLHGEGWEAGDGILAGSGFLAGDQKVRRGTLVVDKAVSLWEYSSCMVQTLTLTGNAKCCRIEAELVPYDCDRASAVNTTSAAWTIADDDFSPVRLQDMALWMDDYSGAVALAAADALGVSEFEIKLENNLEIKRDSLSGLYIAEPRRGGKRRVTGSFTIPRYETDGFFDDHDAQTAQMAMLMFTGPAIGTTGYSQTLWIWLPTIRFDEASAAVEVPGMLTQTLAFTAELPAAVPAGFPTAAEKELVIQIQNNLSANGLLA